MNRRNIACATTITIAVIFMAGAVSVPPQPSVAAVAARLGITAEMIVVCDLSVSLPGLLDEMVDHPDLIHAIETHEHSLTVSTANVSRLENQLRSSPANAEHAHQLSVANERVEVLRQSLDSIKSDLRERVMARASAAGQERSERWLESTPYAVPDSFRTLSCSTREWQYLERSLRVERRAIQRGLEVPDLVRSVLQSARDNEDVRQAHERLHNGSHLSDVRRVLESYEH